MFDIRITYMTGNSFNKYKSREAIDIPMPTLEIAKENLRRIKIHNECVLNRNGYSREYREQTLPSYVIDEGWYYALLILTNPGIELKIIPFWQGHFEELLGATIIVAGEDISFEV